MDGLRVRHALLQFYYRQDTDYNSLSKECIVNCRCIVIIAIGIIQWLFCFPSLLLNGSWPPFLSYFLPVDLVLLVLFLLSLPPPLLFFSSGRGVFLTKKRERRLKLILSRKRQGRTSLNIFLSSSSIILVCFKSTRKKTTHLPMTKDQLRSRESTCLLPHLIHEVQRFNHRQHCRDIEGGRPFHLVCKENPPMSSPDDCIHFSY